jgi:tetratricopeptide (TPR) repeat protein
MQQAIVHMDLTSFRGRPGESQFWERPRGDKQLALDHANQARELFRAVGNPVGEAYALHYMGWLVADLDKPDLAREYCETARTLFDIHNDRTGEASTLACMGYINEQDGQHHHAIRRYEQALALFSKIDNTADSAQALDLLGYPHMALGQEEQARRVWEEAFALYRQQGRVEEADRLRQRLDDLDQRAQVSLLND